MGFNREAERTTTVFWGPNNRHTQVETKPAHLICEGHDSNDRGVVLCELRLCADRSEEVRVLHGCRPQSCGRGSKPMVSFWGRMLTHSHILQVTVSEGCGLSGCC